MQKHARIYQRHHAATAVPPGATLPAVHFSQGLPACGQATALKPCYCEPVTASFSCHKGSICTPPQFVAASLHRTLLD
jgi:hypothetical protein